MSILISIENLLSGKFVEGTRMEFKEGWNPKTIMRSICAFANDFEKGIVRTRRYRNRRIGSFLKELGLTEGKGTGIPIIYKAMEENGSPGPIFDTDDPNRSFFVVEFPIYPSFTEINIGGPIGGPINSLTDRQKTVLELLVKNNKLTKRGLAEILKINVSAAQAHIELLKEKGFLRRIGGTRGYWEIKGE